MSEEESDNYSQLELKEQLYILYLELKGELTKKNIEIDKEQLEEILISTKSITILNYIKELVYILINAKFPKKEEIIKNQRLNKDEELAQLESYIKKLEFDIKFYLQREFQNKITRDTLEMKLNAYMEMENEFEELKEKVKYEGGKFLNNERKDNEIIILRQENSILKKEIEKYKENNKLYESKLKTEQELIQYLKSQISLLNKKISKLEKEKEKINQPNTNNSSINININNNGNSSSKWIIKQENQEFSNYNNNINNLNSNSTSGSNFALKKRRINNFTKNFRKNVNNNTTKFSRYEMVRGYSGFQAKSNNNHSKGMSTIDNNNAFTSTYSKILNNLCSKNKTPNKRDGKNDKKKNNSNTISVDDYEKTMIESKYISNKDKKYKSNGKNSKYNKIIGLIPNSKFPLSSKHQTKNNTPSIPKKYLQREKNSVSHSALIINRK
jgi:hypothetical protein